MRYLLILLMTLGIAGCSPIPVQISKTSQEQTQETRQTAEQQSSHASDARQGTNSMPVIVICLNNYSNSATCATPKDKPILVEVLEHTYKGIKK